MPCVHLLEVTCSSPKIWDISKPGSGSNWESLTTSGGGHLFQEGRSYEIWSETRKREFWPRYQGSKPIMELGEPLVSIPSATALRLLGIGLQEPKPDVPTSTPQCHILSSPSCEAPRTFRNTFVSVRRNLCFVANEGWQITTAYTFE